MTNENVKTSHSPSFSSFDSCVDQSFTSTHRVKKELGWCQSRIEAVRNESFGSGNFRVTFEVRQTAIFKTNWNPFSIENLLTYAGCHLRNVDVKTL